jgi:hypothetical protein
MGDMDTMIHDRICPVYQNGLQARSAILIMAVQDADATGGPYGLRQHEALQSWDGPGASIGVKVLTPTVEPSMMAFFLPTRAQAG